MRHGRQIYILGDVHGEFGALNKFINREIRQNKAAQSPRGFMKKVDDLQVIILQVGDFAYFWPGFDNIGAIKNRIDWLGGQGGLCPLFWCGGNHEDWDKLDALRDRGGQRPLEVDHGIFYCPFGSTLSLSPEVTVMFAGGAESADKGWRLSEMARSNAARLWWSQEGVQETDLFALDDVPSADWVISHTCPTGIPIEAALVGKQHWDHLSKFNEPSRKLLEIVRQGFQPQQWFFGHYHIHAEGVLSGGRGGRQPLVGNVWTFSIGAKADTGKSGWNGTLKHREALKKMDKRKNAALQTAKELCAAHESRLLYLTFFGSELYGTDTGNSDTDVRGIFMPSMQSIILGQDRKSLHYSTGDNEHRNKAGDIDIDLWSIKNWVLNLLPGGDIGALDLLFSVSNKDCIIYQDRMLNTVFTNPLKFLDLANNKSYAQYALGQAKKYGIKGSRLGAIRAVAKWLEKNSLKGRLAAYISDIVAKCGHERYCFAKELPEGAAIVLCGSIHLGSIAISEFGKRVLRQMERYGSRARDAEANQGVDYKALSHALRALDQMEELLLTGRIIFPLASRERLKSVKKGGIPWTEIEGIILSKLADVNRLYEKLSSGFSFDKRFAEKFLLSCHGFSENNDGS